jgi:hypothetical protein
MRQGTCTSCGTNLPLASCYAFRDGKVCCQSCVKNLAQTAKEAGQPHVYYSIIDRTICSRCQADNGLSDHPLTSGRPFCHSCTELLRAWPYPQWLKLALLGLLLLLGFALVHGRKYFQAGKGLYLGERLIEERKYAAGIPGLQAAVDIAPHSDKAVLLLAKAYFLTGDAAKAFKAIQRHNNGSFEHPDDSLFVEVKDLSDRANRAYEKADDASKLAAQPGKAEEAFQKIREAASIYPESTALAEVVPAFEIGVAFEKKDYDRFLLLAQDIAQKTPASAQKVGQLASALACKYAVTGDPALRQRAETTLEEARLLAKASPDQAREFSEYEERIQYRLKSREIIDTPEFNRRFHPDKDQSKK